MKVGFLLNGKEVSLQCDPARRLVDVLRQDFGATGTKAGCYNGMCGSCLVIFNGKLRASCLIPAFEARDATVVTIEGFAKTPEYEDVVTALDRAGADLCGFCAPARVLSIHELLEEHPRPELSASLKMLSGVACSCTGYSVLMDAIQGAAEIRERRRHA